MSALAACLAMVLVPAGSQAASAGPTPPIPSTPSTASTSSTPADDARTLSGAGIQFEALQSLAPSASAAGSAASRSGAPVVAEGSDFLCGDFECPIDPCVDCPVPVPVPPSGCFMLDGSDYVRKELSRGGNPEMGGSFARVKIDTHLQCFGPNIQGVNVQALLVDRTPGRDGLVLAWGSVSGGSGTYVGSGLIDLYDEDYPVGRDAELILQWQVSLWSGTWDNCGQPPAGLRQVRCEGVGTPHMSAGLGTGTFATGVVPPQRTFGTQVQSCYPTIQKSATRNDSNRSATVGLLAQINCRSGFSPQIQMVLDLYDRTPGQADRPLTTRNSGGGSGSVTLASAPVTLFDRDFPKGSQAEVVIEAILRTTDGSKWTRCLPLPAGLREARPCEGLHTDTLKVFVGSGTFPTGVRQPTEECKQDTTPFFAVGIGGQQVFKLVPHVEYCGIFDWGTNSRVTRVTRLAPTEAIPLGPGPICEVDYWAGIGGEGTASVNGGVGTFKAGIRWSQGICEQVNVNHFAIIDRTYQPNGTITNLDRNV